MAADKPGAASAFVERLEQAARLFAQFPDIGAAHNDLLPTLRVFSYRSYGLYFRQDDSRMTVERGLAPGIDLTNELFDWLSGQELVATHPGTKRRWANQTFEYAWWTPKLALRFQVPRIR